MEWEWGVTGHDVWSLAEYSQRLLVGAGLATAGPRSTWKRVKQGRTIQDLCLADFTVQRIGYF